MTPAPVQLPDDETLVRLLAAWLPGRRWFPVKGAVAELGAAGGLTLLDPRGDAAVRILFVRTVAPGIDTVLQVPVTLRATSVDEDAGGPAVIGTTGTPPVLVRDGCGDPAFLRAWLAVADGPGGDVDPDHPRVLTGEQSNTSVVLPAAPDPDGGPPRAAAILKVFRALSPGDNPDVDVPRALAADGWVHVPRPLGWLEGRWPDHGATAEGHLAVLSQFVDGAEDGFELACAMAGRGESFAPLARDLGVVVAGMHAALAEALPVEPPAPTVDRASSVAQAVRDRYRWAASAVPELEQYGHAVEELAARTQHLTDLPVPQRIHGDLHLGQALRAHGEWFVTDFEGEPLAPVAARIRPDLALRDVAGMLRSFDYAAAVGAAGAAGSAAGGDARAWADDARAALLDGYREAALRAASERHDAPVIDVSSRTELLRALELDKAMYEAVYEARNRPAWLDIPLRGIERLLD